MQLRAIVFTLFVLCISRVAADAACRIPLEYLNGLQWKDIKKQCVKVGSGKSMDKCDKCFAAFVAAQTADVIKYIDIMEAIKDPAGTLSSTISACGPTVTKAMGTKLSKKGRKKAKNVNKCFKMNVSEMASTQQAVSDLIGKQLG